MSTVDKIDELAKIIVVMILAIVFSIVVIMSFYHHYEYKTLELRERILELEQHSN